MVNQLSGLPRVEQKGKKGKLVIPGHGEDHNWTKRSIFWDLPYWATNLVRHNLDVMHIEANIFGNIFNTIMNLKKMKDNANARLDVEQLCSRPDLHLNQGHGGNWRKSKTKYCLGTVERKHIFRWLKNLRFPDGYASNWT